MGVWWLIACAVILCLFAIAKVFRSHQRDTKRRELQTKVAQYDPPKNSYWKGKRWLVLYNPFSGFGEGEFIFRNVVAPLFEQSGVLYDGIKTERAGYVLELLQSQSFDLTRYHAIATISGDGGLHEVVNGLYGRLEQKNEHNFKSLLDSVALALIPAGSSNGLATSLGFRDSFDAVRCLLEKQPRPLDLLRVSITPKNASEPCRTFWDPHTVSWAIGSEHDELQELQLRWLPTELRNLVAPLIVIFQAKRHKGKIDFIPVELDSDTRLKGHFSDESNLSPSSLLPGGKSIDDHFIMTAILNSPAGASDMLMSTTLAPDDGSIEIMIIRNGTSFDLLKVFMAFEDASYLTNKLVEHYKVTELSIDPAAPVGQYFISGEKAPIYGRIHIKNFNRFANFVW